jgi:hypothetical protein
MLSCWKYHDVEQRGLDGKVPYGTQYLVHHDNKTAVTWGRGAKLAVITLVRSRGHIIGATRSHDLQEAILTDQGAPVDQFEIRPTEFSWFNWIQSVGLKHRLELCTESYTCWRVGWRNRVPPNKLLQITPIFTRIITYEFLSKNTWLMIRVNSHFLKNISPILLGPDESTVSIPRRSRIIDRICSIPRGLDCTIALIVGICRF